MKVLASFSGGKDGMLAIDRALRAGHEVIGLITTMREEDSWFHELPRTVLHSVAASLQIPLYLVQTGSGAAYEQDYAEAMRVLKERGAEGILFGDIDLLEHRAWCERLAESVGLEAMFPLWGRSRRALVGELLDAGYLAMIQKVDKTKLSTDYLGRILSHALLDELEAQGLDACGENGEYHTVVFDGPLFVQPVALQKGGIREDAWSYKLELQG